MDDGLEGAALLAHVAHCDGCDECRGSYLTAENARAYLRHEHGSECTFELGWCPERS